MRKLINFENAAKTVGMTVRVDIPAYYDLYVTDNVRLSIVTASHFNSASLGTVEVALLVNEQFAMGEENSDDSIIHYLNFDKFKFMVYLFREYMKAAAEKGYNLTDHAIILFKCFKQSVEEGE